VKREPLTTRESFDASTEAPTEAEKGHGGHRRIEDLAEKGAGAFALVDGDP